MRGLIITFLSIACSQLLAQVPVVEAGVNGGPSRVTPVAQQNQSGGNDLLLSMYNQLEALQGEMQTLRGIVEEQGYQLRQLQQESLDRYLDLDQRLSAAGNVATQPGQLPGSSPTSVTTPTPGTSGQTSPQSGIQGIANGTGAAISPVTPVTQPGNTAADTTALNDDELYNSALNLLLEERRYEESVTQFQQYIDAYPQGRRYTNALYWQGEALILLQRLPQARDVFMKLMNEYPQDAKTPGAMLKLGVVYSQMGNRAQAEQLWRDLPARYPQSSPEIREAERFLQQ